MVYDHVFKNSRYKVLIYEEKKWNPDRGVWVYPKHRKLSHFEINPIGSNREIHSGHISDIGSVWMLSHSAVLADKVEKFVREFGRKHR